MIFRELYIPTQNKIIKVDVFLTMIDTQIIEIYDQICNFRKNIYWIEKKLIYCHKMHF